MRQYQIDITATDHGAIETMKRVAAAEEQVVDATAKASAALDQQGSRMEIVRAGTQRLSREYQQLAEAAAADEKWKKFQANMAGSTTEMAKAGRGAKELQAEISTLEEFTKGLGGVLTGGAIVYGLARFVGNVIESRRETANLARDLGISTDAVQVFQYKARDGSTSLATMTTAIEMMDSKIGRGDAGLTAALGKLGLDFETVRHKSKELAFEDITAALAATEDRFKRVGFEAEIFGTQKIDGLVSHYQDLRRAAVDANAVLDPDQIAALQHVGQEWEHLKFKVEGVAASMIANIESAAIKMTHSFQRLFNTVPGGVPDIGSPPPGFPTPDPFGKAPQGTNPLNPERAAEFQVLIGYERELTMAVTERIRLENEAAEARRNVLKITLDLNKEYDAEIKKHDEIIMRMQAESAAAEFKARQAVMGNKGFDAAGNALPGSGPLDQMHEAQVEYEKRLDALRAQAANYQQVTGQPMDTSFREQQLFLEFQAAFQKAAAAATEMATAHTAAAAAGATAATGLSYIAPSADAVAKAFASFGGLQTGGTINYGQPGWWGWSPAGGYTPPPGRAMGGPVDAGRPYVVGEKRPELFVPSSSGRIEPRVGGSPMQLTVSVDARGANFQDDAALDRLVEKVSRRFGEVAGKGGYL